MSRAYIFSDEAGCFVFKRNNRASRYFIVCTVTMTDCDLGVALQDLRRDMIWRKMPVKKHMFHCTEDRQEVRDEVFKLLSRHDFRIDATILEKSKAQPQTRSTNERFYKYAWFYHLKTIGPALLYGHDEAMISAAAIGTKKGQAVYTSAVNDVMQQTIRGKSWATSFPPSQADPCLQIADYCAWAIQRKWERDDTRSYDIIENKVRREYDLFIRGTHHYY